MEFPVEVEEVKSVFSMAKSTAEVIRHLLSQFKEPDDDEAGENGDREDCIKEAILILSKETQAKKSSHVEKFVGNTISNPECELVLCQSLLEGYNFLSLMRASWVVNRQWTVEHC